MWYLTRSAGAVTLVLLTLSVVLGIADTVRWSAPPKWPRFVLDALHRNVSLLVLAVVAVHVVTAVIDSFAPIRLVDAVVPFVSAYRPLWVGLGALAFDMLIAVALTSVLRHRIGFRGWRAVHWLAYACWPIALVHSLGSGTDASLGWMVALSLACVAAVLAALTWRVVLASDLEPNARGLVLAVTGAGLVALVAWAAQGPLASGWASRAGTPKTLLARSVTRTAAAPAAAPATAASPFSARLSGSATQSGSQDGTSASVDIATTLSRGARGTMTVKISGEPLQGGGISMTASRVSLRLAGGAAYDGEITSLQGTSFQADVADSAGHRLSLQANLRIDPSTQTVVGTLDAQRG
jgi:DMSO/TMAO reductase YedYZ heme-binding membrane subunit